jgi:hypothetical protein
MGIVDDDIASLSAPAGCHILSTTSPLSTVSAAVAAIGSDATSDDGAKCHSACIGSLYSGRHSRNCQKETCICPFPEGSPVPARA